MSRANGAEAGAGGIVGGEGKWSHSVWRTVCGIFFKCSAYHMIQQLHFFVFSQGKWKHMFIQKPGHEGL